MTSEPQGLAKLRVLIADANPNMRRIVRAILNGFGCEQIVEAGDGPRATALLRSYPVDIVITEYALPPWGALAFVRKVRGDGQGATSYVPIVMLSSASTRGEVMAARDAGVSEFVTKPVSASALYRRLHAAVHNARAFVRSQGYFGPDRRRTEMDFPGPEQRQTP